MKKSTKKLQLNKEVVASLDNEAMAHVKGGVLQFWTTGCTDGCGTTFFQTAGRCTKQGCSHDCQTNKICIPYTQRCGTRNCPNPTDINTEIECLLRE